MWVFLLVSAPCFTLTPPPTPPTPPQKKYFNQNTLSRFSHASVLCSYGTGLSLQHFVMVLLTNIALEPLFDLSIVPCDPFNVVPRCLHCLFPWHLPSTCIWRLTEEMLHLKDHHGQKVSQNDFFGGKLLEF